MYVTNLEAGFDVKVISSTFEKVIEKILKHLIFSINLIFKQKLFLP